ncbi:ROK family protein [bacterium]|nr:ROK family protein [bacterium]MBU1883553.1 ROK family protein [bacterium]
MTLSIDAGGTNCRAEISDDEGVVSSLSAKTAEIGLSSWIETILNEQKQIKNICIAYAGQVKDGVIISAPNMKIDNHDIKNYFEKRFDVKLFIENDLDCAVLAESTYFDSGDICALYVGTGLGLGVVSSHNLITGYSGVATEIGHIPYKDAPFRCGCGKNNCLELFASGSGIIKFKKHNFIEDSLRLTDLRVSTNMDAKKIYDEFEKALLFALGSVITLFNPEILVLGGGIIAADEDILEIINSKVKDYAMPIALQKLKIVKTQMQNAPLKGALLLKESR